MIFTCLVYILRIDPLNQGAPSLLLRPSPIWIIETGPHCSSSHSHQMYRPGGRELLGVFKHYISHQMYWARGRELLGVFKHFISHQMYRAREWEFLGVFKHYISHQMYRAWGRELLGVFKHYVSHQMYWARGRELLGVFKHYVSHQTYWARGRELLGVFKLYIHSQSSSFLCTIIQQPSVQKYTYSDSSILNAYCLASKTIWQYSGDLEHF